MNFAGATLGGRRAGIALSIRLHSGRRTGELLLHDNEADGTLLELPGSLGAVGLGT